MSQTFEEFKINHIHREENVRAGLLAWLVSTKGVGINNTVTQETLESPSTKVGEIMTLDSARDWMAPITRYLTQNELPEVEVEARRIKRIYVRYLIMVNNLYKMGRSDPMLR